MTLGAGGLWQVSRWDKNLDEATQAWREAGKSFGDIRLDCLSYAILAPNPHNLQPWRIKLEGTDSLTLYCAEDRRLPATDPPNRQITIGFGAFLELLRMAAASKGYHLDTAPFPEGEPYPVLDDRPIAKVRFVRASRRRQAKPSPLFDFVKTRRTMRINFKEKPIAQSKLDGLSALPLFDNPKAGGVVSTNNPKKVDVIKNICLEGWKIELNTPRTFGESVKWTRVGSRQVAENPDGISLKGTPMELFRLLGLLTPEKMGDNTSTAFQATYDFYANLIHSAQGWAWIWTSDNKRSNQLEAGKAWVRLHLQATQLGLALHPVSQVLQEFPEMDKFYREMHSWAGIKAPARIQGLLRLGYATPPAPSPRWNLNHTIIS